ncbi:MAG: class I SAM-dependent methyltransferase [Chloroflexi bacterium]|nr:class I SAM-dependent methyltransferase [Chloroflexota bacterium]
MRRPSRPYVRAYYGVDLAMPMVDRLVGKRNGEPIYPVIGDATRMPFADATFDAAIAVHIFHLIPAYRDAFAEVARVLKPGAVLAHGWNVRHTEDSLQQVWNQATIQAEARSLEEASNSPRPVPFIERAAMLPASGWRLKDENSLRYPVERTPTEFLADMGARVYSMCWSMPDEVLEAGLTAVRAYLTENAIDPDQPRRIESEFRVQTFLPPG